MEDVSAVTILADRIEARRLEQERPRQANINDAVFEVLKAALRVYPNINVVDNATNRFFSWGLTTANAQSCLGRNLILDLVGLKNEAGKVSTVRLAVYVHDDFEEHTAGHVHQCSPDMGNHYWDVFDSHDADGLGILSSDVIYRNAAKFSRPLGNFVIGPKLSPDAPDMDSFTRFVSAAVYKATHFSAQSPK